MLTNRVTRNVVLALLALLMIEEIIELNASWIAPFHALVRITSKIALVLLDSFLWTGYLLGLGVVGVTPLTSSFLRYHYGDPVRYLLMAPGVLLLVAAGFHVAKYPGIRNAALLAAAIFIAVRVAFS